MNETERDNGITIYNTMTKAKWTLLAIAIAGMFVAAAMLYTPQAKAGVYEDMKAKYFPEETVPAHSVEQVGVLPTPVVTVTPTVIAPKPKAPVAVVTQKAPVVAVKPKPVAPNAVTDAQVKATIQGLRFKAELLQRRSMAEAAQAMCLAKCIDPAK